MKCVRCGAIDPLGLNYIVECESGNDPELIICSKCIERIILDWYSSYQSSKSKKE